MLFVTEWTVKTQDRVALWNVLANMTAEDHKECEGPNVKRITHLTFQSGCGGVFIFESDCEESIMSIMLNYGPLVDFTLYPATTDDPFSEAVKALPFFEENKKPVEGTLEKNVGEKAMKYVVQWSSKVESRVPLWNMLGNMSLEDQIKMEGPGIKRIEHGCYSYQTGQGGVFLFEADSAVEIMKIVMLYGSLVDMTVQPATDDATFAAVVQKKPFFQKK